MVLTMSRPVRHPKTGIHQLRKRVPDHLIEIVGKHEEKISLKSRDPDEAKIVHAEIRAAPMFRHAIIARPRHRRGDDARFRGDCSGARC